MILLLLLICLAAVAVYKLLPVFSGSHQAFTDIILENVSLSGFNKSGELQLFWLILAIGAVILCAGMFLWDKKHTTAPNGLGTSAGASVTSIKEHRIPLYAGMVTLPFAAYLVVFGQFSIPLFMGLIAFILSQSFCREFTSRILLTLVLTYYALMSILTLGVHITAKAQFSDSLIYGIAFSCGIALSIIAVIRHKKNAGDSFSRHTLLLLQCFLPGLLSIWLVNDYLYQGQLITVPFAPGYVVFFAFFIGIALFLTIRQAVKFWNSHEKYIIGAVTPIIIFVYHSFSAAPMYAQPDQHHHGEQMIPWNQIFEHGLTLYEEYTPVSGLFPFVNGFIHNILLGGTITEYPASISITMVIFCIITMYLIYKHVGGAYATAFAVLFTLPSYNRQYMVLPVLLLLTLPGLLQKKHIWLQVWIYACFLSGLYYPLFGAGLLLGTMPLGIYQFVTFIKGETFKKLRKQIPFIISWVILILIIIANIPLLLNMLNHTLTYSSQTIMADGIPLLGQQAPDYFLPYLVSFYSLRQALYLALRFLLPVIGVWLFIYFIYSALRRKDWNTALVLASGAIALLISYTYTLVRADVGKILSRTGPVLIAVAGMFLPIVIIQYGKNMRKRYVGTWIIGICCGLPLIIYAQISHIKNPDIWVYPDGESQLVMDDGDKLFSYYEVPDNFLKSEDTGLSQKYQALLGNGFMVADQIPYIMNYSAVIEKCEAVSDGTPITYMALDGQGFYDYLNIPCSATGYIPAARSFEAQKAIWDTASANLPVVFYLQPENSYYIFRFMLDGGYVYCAEDQAFYPPELYNKIYGESTDANIPIGDDYRQYASYTDFKTHAASFGASMDSLSDIFTQDKTIRLNLDGTNSFPAQFSGAEYDCLYLELSEEFTKELTMAPFVLITWTDADGNYFECNMVSCYFDSSEKVKLLIPMGMNAGWTLSEINNFTISVYDGSGNISLYAETTYEDLLNHNDSSLFIEDMALMQINRER